jgi:hypothetical protein
VNTMPYIAYAVSYVSRFMQEPHSEHLLAVKHILIYLAGTWSCGLFYQKGEGHDLVLVGYNNKDLAGDVDGRRSTIGMVFFLGGVLLAGSLQNKQLLHYLAVNQNT